jgi:ligand-binding sensor domain-containing protein
MRSIPFHRDIKNRPVFVAMSMLRIGFALLCVGSATAEAQYRFDHWTADNGLPQNSVRDIVQTGDGYLWFTTFDGLVRFDGVRFTVSTKAIALAFPVIDS